MSVTAKGRWLNDPEVATRAALASAVRTTSGQSSAFNIEDAAGIEAILKITAAAGGTYEIQSVIATGATAGQFRLQFTLASQPGVTFTSGLINWNDNAAAVLAALLAATGTGGATVPAGSFAVGGGALPGNATTITFAGIQTGPQSTMVVTASTLVGGAAAVTRPTPGVGPTLDVKLQVTSDKPGQTAPQIWEDSNGGPFPQKVGPGQQTRRLPGNALQGRWVWAIAGSGASFTFKIDTNAIKQGAS